MTSDLEQALEWGHDGWAEVKRLEAIIRKRCDEIETTDNRIAAALEKLRSVFNLRSNCNTIEDAVEDACNEIDKMKARISKMQYEERYERFSTGGPYY